MADDINLPNLVSHLNVNLDGVSGAIGDAARQGSAMGSALGNGINRQLDDLLRHLPQVTIDGDSEPLDRDLARVHRDLARLDSQRIGVDISVPDALRQLEELETHLQRIGDEHPDVNVRAATAAAARQLEELRQAARHVDDTDVRIDVDVDEDRAGRFAGILGRMGRLAGPIAGVAASVGTATAAFGAAVPAAAAVVTTLENVAPAAGVAVTGMAAIQLASGAVKLAAVGMQDALTAALDPAKAKDFDKALEKLSPSARKFATTVRDMGPALREVQQSVQERVFSGLAEQLERTGTSVLPVLRTNLLSTADTLNTMGRNTLTAAGYLAENGTLGTALGSASAGLRNLAGVPALVVNGLGQIAAAAGPSFERLTAGAAKAATGIGDRMSAAFESGQMQASIEKAMGLLRQLMTVGGNVGTIIGNIFNAVPSGGGGLISLLSSVTDSLAKITATKGVQDAFRSLFQTMAAIGATAGPLLAQALAVIGPVVTALGPPIQQVVAALGAGLQPIIAALGPVLAQAAGAIGVLISALAPLLPVIGQLVASLLPAFTPLLAAFQTGFQALAPVVQQVAGILQATLAPILAQLPAIIAPLAALIADRLVFFFQLLGQVMVQLGPTLVSLGQTIGVLLAAIAPLLSAFVQLQAQLFSALMPVLTRVISVVAAVAQVLVGTLAAVLQNVVVPIIQVVAALLSGNFSGAWNIAKGAALAAGRFIAQQALQMGAAIAQGVSLAINWLKGMGSRAVGALSNLGSSLAGTVASAGSRMAAAISAKVSEAVAWVRGLPGRAAAALGSLAGSLYAAGGQLIQGLINGVKSKVGSLISSAKDAVSGAISAAKNVLGIHSPSRVFHEIGVNTIRGFIQGIDGTTAQLRAKVAAIVKQLPDNTKTGIGKLLARGTAELQRQITKRDGVIKALAAAQKRLDDLVKARDKAAGDITSGILSEANITTGHADVNSVSAITVELQQALKASQAFQANIVALRKAGLRSDLLQQIADAGVAGGAATAAALAKATPAQLAQINSLQAQLAKSATATGATVGDALYGAGIRAAQGLVSGLQSQKAAIEKVMRQIAQAMIDAVKKVHKTKSPSRAFADIGRMDMEGWRGGVVAHAARVISAARDTAHGVLDAASGVGGALAAVPTGAQIAGAYGGAAGLLREQNNVFNLYGSEASPDGILRALSWQGLVAGGA